MSEERRAGMAWDEFNQIAWRDFLVFAQQEHGMVDAFNRATGRRYQERGICQPDDELAADTEAFVLWVTENHWGMEYAPLSYQAEHKRS